MYLRVYVCFMVLRCEGYRGDGRAVGWAAGEAWVGRYVTLGHSWAPALPHSAALTFPALSGSLRKQHSFGVRLQLQ